jgi:hypothetical protein
MNTTLITNNTQTLDDLDSAARALALLSGNGEVSHVLSPSGISVHESALRELQIDPRVDEPSKITGKLIDYGLILLSLLPWIRFVRAGIAGGMSARSMAIALRNSLRPSVPAALKDEQVLSRLIDLALDEKGVAGYVVNKDEKAEDEAMTKTLKTLNDYACYVPLQVPPFHCPPEDGPMLKLEGMPGSKPVKFGKQIGKTIAIAVGSKLVGMAAGAAIGSVIPGIGTVVGALVGLGMGLLGNKKDPKESFIYRFYAKTEGQPNLNMIVSFLNKVLKDTNPRVYEPLRAQGNAKGIAEKQKQAIARNRRTIGAVKRMQFITGLNLNPLMAYVRANADPNIPYEILGPYGNQLKQAYTFPIAKGDVYALVNGKPQLLKQAAKKQKDALMEAAEYDFPGDSHLQDTADVVLGYNQQLRSYSSARVAPGMFQSTVAPRDCADDFNGYLFTLGRSAPVTAEETTGIFQDAAQESICRCETPTFWLRDESLPAGRAFASNAFTVDIGDLPLGVYGEVDLGARPFRMTLNRRVKVPRMFASFSHEAFHIMDALFKLNLTHEQVHALGVYLAQEVMPAYHALESRVTSANRSN